MRKCLVCGHEWWQRKEWDEEEKNHCGRCKRPWGISLEAYNELVTITRNALPPNPPANWNEVINYIKIVREELKKELDRFNYRTIPIESAFTVIEDIFNFPRLPRLGF